MAKNFNRPDHPRGNEPEAFSDPKISEVHTQLAREKQEPREGFSGVPIIVVFLFCALGFWGSVYFTRNSGGFKGDVFVTKVAKEEAAETGPKPVEKQIKDGEKLFLQNCALCHQANGQGAEGAFLRSPAFAVGSRHPGPHDQNRQLRHERRRRGLGPQGQRHDDRRGRRPQRPETRRHRDLRPSGLGQQGRSGRCRHRQGRPRRHRKRGSWTLAEILALHPLEK